MCTAIGIQTSRYISGMRFWISQVFASVFLICFYLSAAVVPNLAVAAERSDLKIGLDKFQLARDYLVQKHSYLSGKYDARSLVESMQEDGSWVDVNYSGQSLALWEPMLHLNRLSALAIDHIKNSRNASVNTQELDSIKRGLQLWEKKASQSRNWWYRDLGVPQQLIIILLACKDSLNDSEIESIKESYFPKFGKVPSVRLKGQNIIWYANVFYGMAVLFDDSELLHNSRSLFLSALKVDDDEGVQYDFSFHQHGKQFYSGGYGLDFLIDSVELAYAYKLVGIGINKDKVNFLLEYGLKGIYPIVRSGWIDWSARGREVGRHNPNETKVPALALALERLEVLAGESSLVADLAAFRQSLTSGSLENKSWLGSKYYWNSNYLVHQTNKLYASVRVADAFSVAAEGLNGENSSGYWAPFGSTYLLTKDQDYVDAYPFFDWSRIPGVTSLDTLPELVGYLTLPNSLSVGLADDDVGLVGFKFDHLGLRASRAWFFYKNEFLMMGSGITSSSDKKVVTTLIQRVRKKETPTSSSYDGASPIQLFSGGIFYKVQTDGFVNWSQKSVESKVGSEGSEIRQVEFAWIDHGVKPVDASFVVKGLLDEGESGSAKVLINSKSMHAASFDNGQLVVAIFHAAGVVNMGNDYLVSVDKPAAIIFKNYQGKISTTFSTPVSSSNVNLKIYKGKKVLVSRLIPLEDNGYNKTGVSLRLGFSRY
ncbi:MAG: polysaccharide lyase family 8 super-sandwich domain-containing protein [bacterium]|nr:polysaccharide lyase family 8 super-sandwich domain-containing protein [bacterium]